MTIQQPVEILRRLAAGQVEFIVVGMVAGILRGVPVSTLDIDIVHNRRPENVARLLQVLRSLEAVYRYDRRRLPPTESLLAGPGHNLLTTTQGDLDCLGEIDGGRGYESLLAESSTLSLEDGSLVRALDLTTLIGIKERSGRPKDLAVLPILRATLDESSLVARRVANK